MSGAVKFSSNEEAPEIDQDLLTSFVDSLIVLRPFLDHDEASLPSEVETVFSQIRTRLTILYETDYYPILDAAILDTYRAVTKIKVGSVGAFLLGCHLSKGDRCTALCAGSRPGPRSEYLPCNYGVVILTLFKDGSIQRVQNFAGISGSKRSLVYIAGPSQMIETSIGGLTDSERKILEKTGVAEISLDAGDNWITLASTPVLAPRHFSAGRICGCETTPGTASHWFLIVLILLILVVIIAVLHF